jgi:pimeloyl-ACP methyl ester carboxylesterase
MVLTVIAWCAGVLTAMALVQTVCAWTDRRKFPFPGRMVNIVRSGATAAQAGHRRDVRLHAKKLGAGSPPVIMEAGFAASSLNWSLLQPQVAAFAPTLSYDRAGLGWSNSDGRKCTLGAIVEELHGLLHNMDLPAPYILVGHSFGGYIVRCYAQHYSDEVAGVVMVDPLTPEEWVEPTASQRRTLRLAARIVRVIAVLASLGVVRLCLWLALREKAAKKGVAVGLFGPFVTSVAKRIENEINKLPPEIIRLVRTQWSCAKPFWTFAKYLDALPACAREAANCSIPAHVPVTVISGKQQPEIRLREHEAIAKHSLHGNHILAGKSGHWIQFDQPELIVGVLRDMMSARDLTAVRGPT